MPPSVALRFWFTTTQLDPTTTAVWAEASTAENKYPRAITTIVAKPRIDVLPARGARE